MLNSPDFAKAVKDTGVCILPIGALERHGNHAPLGTDGLIAHETCIRAAELEDAVVFPPLYFGQINEAKCFPGAVTLDPVLHYNLIDNVVSEIARNGFHKILIYNGHGGNWSLLQYFIQCQLHKRKDYTIYMFTDGFPYDGDKLVGDEARKIVSKYPCHAGEWETSYIMAVCPGSVDMADVDPEPGLPLGRLSHLSGCTTATGWYADFPRHYDGDARGASREKGEQLLKLHTEHLAQFIKAVKQDTVAPALQKEIYDMTDKVGQ